jgi:hypothetical protein
LRLADLASASAELFAGGRQQRDARTDERRMVWSADQRDRKSERDLPREDNRQIGAAA